MSDLFAGRRHRQRVVDHPWFSDQEKRTILPSWVRDELVKEQVARKALPELKPHSQIDARAVEVLVLVLVLATGDRDRRSEPAADIVVPLVCHRVPAFPVS
jgi:hypothetical protein